MTRPPLALVKPGQPPPSVALVAAVPVPSSRVRLLPWARMEVEQARELLMELDDRTAGADLPRLAYLLGLLEGRAQTLLDVLDAVTEVG